MNLAPKVAIGLMSGTSCDGVDAALIETDGETVFSSETFCFVPFELTEQKVLKSTMAKVAQAATSEERSELAQGVEALVRGKHRLAVERLLKEAGKSARDIDVIGFHGQTLFHEPEASYTLQVGDGSALSKELGIPVVYDFRSKDMQFGGQGAPMVPIYHHALVKSLLNEGKLQLPVAVVNIGGVANVTYIGDRENACESHSKSPNILAFDTGPGNALINDWVEAHTGELMDEGGRYASLGNVDEAIVQEFLEKQYFLQLPPKSLDRDEFEISNLSHLSLEDGAATLTEITARTISLSSEFMDELPNNWVIVGGGGFNKELMRRLSLAVEQNLTMAESLGWKAERIEAEAFGFLAVRHLAGLPYSFPRTTGVEKPLCGGVLAGAL